MHSLEITIMICTDLIEKIVKIHVTYFVVKRPALCLIKGIRKIDLN